MSNLLTIYLACSSVIAAAPQAAADPAEIEFFEKRVRPVLAAHCYECHGDDEQEASLSLTSVAAMLRGGDQGPALVPGDPEASLMVKAIRYEESNFQMPPKAKLSNAQIASIVEWIKRGAVGPDDSKTSQSDSKKKFDLSERAKHWCFQPLAATEPPAVRDAAWCRSPLDRFVLAKLEEKGLHPAAEAEARTLCRRLYFDLTGLPPTIAETDAFVAAVAASRSAAGDASTGDAYAALVDRLLASPRFGERWGRHWLDLVRYAESRGHEFDSDIPNAWQYRDYVVRALNADVPYDQFVVEHLAGDLLSQPRTNAATGANESILGTGFWFLGEECHSPVDIRQDETDRVDNKLDVMSKTFLGLTLACARCHDHKFDPLSTRDYYALSGFVLSMSYRQAAFEAADFNHKLFEAAEQESAAGRAAAAQAMRRSWEPALAKVEKYLPAVREVLQRQRNSDRETNRAALVAAIAKNEQLDERRLAAWVDAADKARADFDDPLGDWVRYVERGPSALRPNGKLAANKTTRLEPAADPLRPTGPFAAWFQDGFTFRRVATAADRAQLGDDPQRPLRRFDPLGALVFDRQWDVLQADDGRGTDRDRITWQQTGRTIKSPTFTLSHGRLWYLVRGSAHLYAEVATHRLNAGPLHGQLAKSLGGGDRPRWVEHDLRPYVGRRVHLEFSPFEAKEANEKASAEFALLDVVEGEQPPPLPSFTAADRFGTFTDAEAAAPETVARRIADHLRAAAAELTATTTAADSANPSLAATTDWLLRNDVLFRSTATDAPAELVDFFARRSQLQSQLRTKSACAPAAFAGSGVDEYVLIRGQHGSQGELVPRRFLEVIDGAEPLRGESPGGRLELARRLLDGRDPLPARVVANRVWYHLLGRGIVRSVDNFGVLGDLPTHPELLDYLAREFMHDGWSVKRLIREIVLSATYRQASAEIQTPSAELTTAPARSAFTLDPENTLLHHARVKRLEAEAIRDAVTAVAGRLDDSLGGPSVPVHLTPFMQGRGKPGRSGPLDGDGRRSLYLSVRRNFLSPMFLAFDYPTPFTTIGRRTTSNVPAQALSLLNSPLVSEMANRWAKRLLTDLPDDGSTTLAAARIDRLYREALARSPRAEEVAAAQEFLQAQAALYAGEKEAAHRTWADLCHVLFNVKEFIFVP